MKTIIGLYKTEAIATTVFHDGPHRTLADIEYATAGWVDWYNHRRLHGSLGTLTIGRPGPGAPSAGTRSRIQGTRPPASSSSSMKGGSGRDA